MFYFHLLPYKKYRQLFYKLHLNLLYNTLFQKLIYE